MIGYSVSLCSGLLHKKWNKCFFFCLFYFYLPSHQQIDIRKGTGGINLFWEVTFHCTAPSDEDGIKGTQRRLSNVCHFSFNPPNHLDDVHLGQRWCCFAFQANNLHVSLLLMLFHILVCTFIQPSCWVTWFSKGKSLLPPFFLCLMTKSLC